MEVSLDKLDQTDLIIIITCGKGTLLSFDSGRFLNTVLV